MSGQLAPSPVRPGSRGLAEAVVEQLGDGVLVIVDDEVVLANSAMCRLVGVAVDELVGHAPPAWMPRLGGSIEDLETSVALPAGRARAVSLSTRRFRTADGEPARLVTVTDRSAQVARESELVRLADRDGLTGLLNQRAFRRRLHEEAARRSAVERPLGLIVLDLDHFKAINDEHGHPIGDRVLAEAAERVSSVTRAVDSVGRIGGEEFGWILPDASADELLVAAERLRERLSGTPFAGGLRVTASIGFCALASAHDAESLMQRADTALYWAKQSGRDVALGWSSSIAARIRRLQLGRACVDALAAIADEVDPAMDRGHGDRVAALAVALAIGQGWSARDQARMHQAGRLHDLGKVAVSPELLGRPGPLEPLEGRHVRAHAAIGAALAADALDDEQREWIRGHHAPWDEDRGEPSGATLLALADTWDAMTSDRCYRQALDRPAALREIARCSGTQLHPRAVEMLTAALRWWAREPAVQLT